MSAVLPRGERGAAGTRTVVVLVVVVVVLAAALFGVDAYAHGRVEREVATQLQAELGTPATPAVDVHGWPFLTQVVGRRLDEVHLVADGVGTTNDAALPLEHLDMTLSDVSTDDWWKTETVGHAEGTALVGYDVLATTAGVPLRYVGQGRFSVDGSQSLAGVTISGTITWGLTLDAADQTVSLADPTVEVAGYQLPEVVAQQLVRAVVRPIPIEGVPFDLRVTSVDAQDDGLHVGLDGTDIPVQR